jgi:hypothetical protein
LPSALLLNHLLDLIEQLLAKVAERLADDFDHVGELRRKRTGAVRGLAEAYAMMERLRTLNAFARYERSESDAIN